MFSVILKRFASAIKFHKLLKINCANSIHQVPDQRDLGGWIENKFDLYSICLVTLFFQCRDN